MRQRRWLGHLRVQACEPQGRAAAKAYGATRQALQVAPKAAEQMVQSSRRPSERGGRSFMTPNFQHEGRVGLIMN